MTRALALLAALGCGEAAPVLRPVIDVPDGLDPYGALDDLELAVARRGQDTNIVAASFRPGQPMSLPEIPFEDDLIVHLIGRAGMNELAYGRTCALDLAGGTLPDAPRLYFSTVLEWAPALDPGEDPRRDGARAYTLGDGSALFVGGGAVVDTAVRFQPLDGSFDRLEPTVAARRGAQVVPLADGDDRALVVGGVDGGGDAVDFVEVLHPTAVPAQQVRMVTGGPRVRDHAAVTLTGGGVLVAGGRTQADDTAAFVVSPRAWIFRLGEFGLLEDPAAAEIAPLAIARAGATMTRLDDERGIVLVAGGAGEDGLPIGATELYVPSDGAFIPGADLAEARSGHVAVPLRGLVLIAGGTRAPGVPVATIELYRPFELRFEAQGALPLDAGVTDVTATVLPDGRVLLAGGIDASGQVTSAAYLVDYGPDGLDVQRIGDLVAPRAGHAAALLCDGTVLVVGGADSPASERLNPPSSGRRR